MILARKTWTSVSRPEAIQAAETMYCLAAHISESSCHAKHASPAMRRPPDVAMPATIAKECWKPIKSERASGSFSSLPRKYGGSTPPLRHGILRTKEAQG
eukprot:scaffold26564_cov101-Isochrysis_galbana.AAC.3